MSALFVRLGVIPPPACPHSPSDSPPICGCDIQFLADQYAKENASRPLGGKKRKMDGDASSSGEELAHTARGL
eukprot:scaffold254965_cov28-Tisochrysis_lutea.AAC.3